jgi:hypothetical protein
MTPTCISGCNLLLQIFDSPNSRIGEPPRTIDRKSRPINIKRTFRATRTAADAF